MALRKPSDFFGKKQEENNLPVVESDNTLREELSKVESLSEQISQLQQELTQKVVKTDLEQLVISQINEMRDNFEYLQNEIHQSNQSDISKFKEVALDITETVNNLIENEIPKYKRQITSNEVRVSNQFETFKEEVEEKVEKFYETLKEFNDVVQVIETVTTIEKYIEEHHSDLVTLREEVFEEIKQIPVGNIQENLERLEKKIDYIRETYSRMEPEVVAREIIQEGLLNEPPETKNEDPLTPLNQNFVTLEQLQEHYRLFINRIQQQLATFGGGGETKLKYLDDVVGIATDPSSYDGKFLKYDHSLGKFVFETVSGGGGGGSQGIQGVQGTVGDLGAQGISGSVGVQGVQGTIGSGTQGIQGMQGVQGLQGTIGSGTQGTQGVQGPIGISVQGSTGSQGIMGIQGPSGSGGDGGGSQGTQGTEGSQGTSGSQGVQGTSGSNGSQGISGSQGTQGVTGTTGNTGGVPYTFSTTTTDADPGNGTIKYDNSSIGSVSFIYIDNNDANSNVQTTWYDTWDDSTSTTKGYLTIQGAAPGSTVVNLWRITGAVTVASGYYKIPVSHLSGSIPTNGASITVDFSRAGDQGVQGTSGIQGAQGVQGLSNQGVQGTTGASILSTSNSWSGGNTFSGITTFSGNVFSTAILQAQQVEETYNAYSTSIGAGATVALDCSTGNTFYITSTVSGNWTANLTNLSLSTTCLTNVTLLIVQGATAYVPNALQIGGVSQTINWQGGSTPGGNNSKKDAIAFTIFYTGSAYNVFGQLVTFG